jgi:hypothetical protein
MKAQAFVDAMRALVGTPFRHQGRTLHGVDCIGTIILARLSLGPWPATRFDVVNYRRNPLDAMEVNAPKFLERIEKPEVGALVLIRWPKMKHANHIAAITPTNIIHAYETVGRVIETRYGEPWLRQTVAIYRIPGMEQ